MVDDSVDVDKLLIRTWHTFPADLKEGEVTLGSQRKMDDIRWRCFWDRGHREGWCGRNLTSTELCEIDSFTMESTGVKL